VLNCGRNNYRRGCVGSFLREQMLEGSHVSIVSAYFTIYAYAALQAELDDLAGVRFLFGEPRFVRAIDPERTNRRAHRIEDNGIELANRLEQSRVARACAAWIRDKVEIRSIHADAAALRAARYAAVAG
jgi:hypothetical protein